MRHAIAEETPPEAWSVPYSTKELSHGRITERTLKLASLETGELDFPGARTIALLTRQTTEKKTGEIGKPETVAQISSLVAPPPETFLGISRNHWFIEDGLFNILDTTYQEDRQTLHVGNGPLNMTLLKAFAISCKNLLGLPSMPEAQSYFKREAAVTLKRLRSTRRLLSG